jgi:DNA-binding Lrp family transcriptional regulator
MLEKLLNEIRIGNTSSPAVLAERLNLSLNMVNAMLETLEEQGYLKNMAAECSAEKPCTSCPISNLCSTKSNASPRIRVVTTRDS